MTLIGPMPPPVDGQSMVMAHVLSLLREQFPRLRVADTAEPVSGRRVRTLIKVTQAARACRSIPGSNTVYIAVKADRGMWLNSAAALFARLFRARIFLHHHSYTYLRERTPRMVALTRAAGPRAHHIVLAQSMARSLCTVMPEITTTLVINNAGLVDRSLLNLPLKADGSELVLGHLSNLFLDKGIAEVVDLALALQQAGTGVRLIVAGPITEPECRHHLERAADGLGPRFDYRGPVTGSAKQTFFQDITHFALPSRYVHESVPLVLYEAMAAGVVCLSTRHGSIPEQLAGPPAVLADSKDSFVTDTLPVLLTASVSHADSGRSRDAFRRALNDFDRQFADFVVLINR